jgi:hypothetical protein
MLYLPVAKKTFMWNHPSQAPAMMAGWTFPERKINRKIQSG